MSSSPSPISPRLPWFWVLLGLAGAGCLLFPLIGLSTRVPWFSLKDLLYAPETAQLLGVTVTSALVSTVLATVLGLALALWISTLGRASWVARLVIYLPLALPPVTAGLALTAAFGRRGLSAPVLDFLGVNFAFAFPGVVLAHLFISLPFVVATTDQALRQLHPEVILSARSLGLTPVEVLNKITIPTLTPAIFSGAALAFSRSLGEFGTTLTFAGSMPGVTRTVPIGIYLERETSPQAAYGLSAILIILAVLLLCLAGLPWLVARTRHTQTVTVDDFHAEELCSLTAPTKPVAALEINYRERALTVPARSLTTVIGVNGSGKTTLMKGVAGRVKLPGLEVSQSLAPNTGVVMLTQNPGLPPFCTAAGAITMVTKDPGYTNRLLRASGLAPLASFKVSGLSGGQAAQIALLRALATRPGLLILDEPLSSVDASQASRWRHFLALAAQTRTTLLVTHDLRDLVTASSHTMVMDSGIPCDFGATLTVLDNPVNQFVATLAGRNIMHGKVEHCSCSVAVVNLGSQHLQLNLADNQPLEDGDKVRLTFPVAAVHAQKATALFPSQRAAGPSAGQANTSQIALFQATVENVQFINLDSAMVRVTIDKNSILASVDTPATAQQDFKPGATVTVSLEIEKLRLHTTHTTHTTAES